MVMADRPDVRTASAPITAVTLVGLGESLVNGIARLPFRQPWHGPSGVLANTGENFTRQMIRSFMGYSIGLPIAEFRSMERVLDRLCKVVLPPWVGARDGVRIEPATVGGVPGIWARPENGPIRGTILYLHGGGYIGTSPSMYATFVGAMAAGTACEIFVADYRLAPEFPFPAGLDDAADAYAAMIDGGSQNGPVDPGRLIVAGDSGGGGLAASLISELRERGQPAPAGLLLFSPEVDLDLDQPSVSQNADLDILPWNIPVTGYLHGLEPDDAVVSAAFADPAGFPPVLVTVGSDEMFRDSILGFAAHLDAAGIEVEIHEEEGMFHVFPIVMPWAQASRRVLAALDDFVSVHLRMPDGATSPGRV